MSNTFKMTKSIWQRSWAIRTLKHEYGSIVITLLGVAVAFLCLFTFSKAERWILNEKIVITSGITWVRTAFAKEPLPDIGDCEQYRPIVQKYFGKLTDEALFVAKMEGGCIADRVSPPNSDGSKDYCTFQINKERLAAQSLEVCVRRAFEKYTAGRVGEENWSDFYAVCPRNIDPVTKKDLPPIPKYPKVIKNCS